MSRRAISSSPWSFLDTISGALGAILFLFIIVDKGGGEESSPPVNGSYPKAYLSLDTATQELHGILHDSLMRLEPGKKLMIVVDAISPKPIPPVEECSLQHFETVCTLSHVDDDRPRCPNPNDHLRVCPDPSIHNKIICKNPADHTKTFCDDEACKKTIIQKVDTNVISLPFAVVFSLEAPNRNFEIDIQVSKNNGDWVNGGDKRDKATELIWLQYKRSIGAKKGTEVIILEDPKKISGTYVIQGRLNRRHSSPVKLKATASTKKDIEVFPKTVNPDNQWVTFGRIKIDSNGYITKL